jgi:hypothetical protein
MLGSFITEEFGSEKLTFSSLGDATPTKSGKIHNN